MPTHTQVHYSEQNVREEIRYLAEKQSFTLEAKPLRPIPPILNASRETLTEVYRELARAAKQKAELSTAAEWLIDNFYITQEQIVQLKEDLPLAYYKKLPRLTEGSNKGLPRVYELVKVLALLSDNIIDQDNATTAVKAYQQIQTLSLGELWAIPIMIRLVLIELLVDRSEELLELRRVRDLVDRKLDEFFKEESDEPGHLLATLREIDSEHGGDEVFLTILAQRLQSMGALSEMERNWFDYKFRRWNTTLEGQLQVDAQRTSRLQLSVQNAISSLREVSETNWSGFIEDNSLVERILRLDPSGFYPSMDFKTRDRYRKRVERLSAHSPFSEPEIAERALLLTEQSEQAAAPEEGARFKKTHIGYYLVDEGYEELLQKVDYKIPLAERLRNWARQHPGSFFGLIFIHVAVLLALVSLATGLFRDSTWIMIAITLGAAFLPALDLSVVSTNRLLSLLLPPRLLPKLELPDEVPDEYRTVVVVPTLFSSPQDVRDQFEALEIRALANPNHGLQFVMLSDFTDAPEEHMPADAEILETAREQVRELNSSHGSKYGKKFFLLHRSRQWNPGEGVWMGWERKRGKLEELNRLLRNRGAETTFIDPEENTPESVYEIPVRYVITLDADTKLPPGGATDLIRTAAHPLNRAEIDASGDVVTKGYGIFQPRISIPPKAANKTWFSRVFSGNVGIDPYTTAVSDVYQDLFGEGVFTGKGLYDLEAFESILDGRFPENTILSHDLLESTYLRTALVSDIELFDDYPTTYLSYSKRNHRWIRGDWQILPWLFARVPGGGGERQTNPANIVSRWKIFDNLRRSVSPLALLVFLLLGWTVLPGLPIIWTLAALGITAFPIYSSISIEIFGRPSRVVWKRYLEKVRINLQANTVQAISTFLFLPHQAFISVDAISRTLWRRYISHKHLLEWTTASQTEQETNGSPAEYWQKMWINLAWAVLCLAVVTALAPGVLPLAIPFVIAWAAAPAVAYRLSQRLKVKKETLEDSDITELRIYMRRTWHYFDRYVNESTMWLPPDNYQEEPYLGAVERTSPTNMGMALTSVYTAYEFGYLTLTELLNRLGNMLGSMKLLDRYKGHFYNWYDTRSGEILHPYYVSTVDSGNLAGSLLIVKQALQHLDEKPWPNPAFWDGMRDTLLVLQEITEDVRSSGTFEEIYGDIFTTIESLEGKLPKEPLQSAVEWEKKLMSLLETAKQLDDLDLEPLRKQMGDTEFEELALWFKQPLKQINRQLKEIRATLPKSIGVGQSINPDGAGTGVKEYTGHRPNPFTNWMKRAGELASWCDEMVWEMDFSILYKKDRNLFTIGYTVDRATQDKATYDLLASEARLASFIAIAKGEVPPRHWFRLSRRLTSIERNEILLSWSGTMFEYLMPLLFLSRIEETLLSNTYDNVVRWQRNYGALRGLPWGYSESAYSVLNLELHYQYRAFGAPGLGLRRGLAEDYVVAPYASMLALMVLPATALENLKALKKEGAYGLNGFYESIDYTPKRQSSESEGSIVKMYMAHHQGMSMMALANVLKDNIMQRLFHEDPLVQSCELLLQERIPRGIPIKEPRPIDVELEPGEDQKIQISVDHAGQNALDDTPPRTHILSNGQYSTVVTHAGTGYSYFNDVTLTRWRPDRVQDPYGFFLYARDLESHKYWSVGHQPVRKKADRYDTWFHPGKVQTARVDEWIESFMEVCVSPEDNIELRKVTLTNYSDRRRRIELTSYAEIVLNQQEADVAHPAFSNLFIQTDHIPEHNALTARRRPRNEEEQPVWLVHTLASEGLESTQRPLEYETDRGSFIGRGRTLAAPAAMDPGHTLSRKTGNVPDPIISIRQVVELGPGESKSITFGLGKATSREEAIQMADRYDNPYATDRVFELASIYGRVELEHIGMGGKRAHYFQKMAGALMYGSDRLRADEEVIKRNRRTQAGLWPYGISGDLPILVYHIEDTNQLRYIDMLLKAHTLWRLKGFSVDLVIINEHPPSYIDELQDELHRLIQSSLARQQLNQRGGVFVIKAGEMEQEDQVLLAAVAKVILKGRLSRLSFEDMPSAEPDTGGKESEDFRPIRLSEISFDDGVRSSSLLHYNGYGGFSPDGREYVIHLRLDKDTGRLIFPPAPWINVLANPQFGCITSERGSDYTWSRNSRENRLTPWSNDAVTDPPGEALYIRDEDNGLFWSPVPGPVLGSAHYEVRHGFGYTCYRSRTLNIDQEVTKWVPADDPVKLVKLSLTNTELSSRTLSIFRYLDWVLGAFRDKSSHFIVTDLDREAKVIFARNHYNNEFAGRVAFASYISGTVPERDSFTSDRARFIGRNRQLDNPEALQSGRELNNRFGAGFDPCAASQSVIELNSGETVDFYFILGEADTEEQARELLHTYSDPQTAEASLKEVKAYWKNKLTAIQIDTPASELNVLANGWLQYQNIACRMWARTGFYQSGGAFGFRDQLQDATAVLYLDPRLARNQILLHAAHQFVEGDVLHWWHPPTGRGIRSRITDDLLWLPYVTAFYINYTGDEGILKERVRFIASRVLKEGEHEAYLIPEDSGRRGSLYEHCCRAIDRSLTSGPHGLPLIGTGDWNDGMDRVGEHGKGESVWLGFFLYTILQDFIPLCRQQQDTKRVEAYVTYQKQLKEHLNKEGWDGSWYRRAFYDDGTPLGSSENEECKIDTIAQAWSVLSGAATPEKAEKALRSAERYLVSEEEGIIRLLTPAFDQTPKNPGYIKGYLPGVRENGGQYTHGALWLVKAIAEMGWSEKAISLIRMLTPVSHSSSKGKADLYKVEPYAVAADIYGEPPLTGMGGWTWYTGSAGWMYRVILESILGVRVTGGDTIHIKPTIVSDWKSYSIHLRDFEGTTYRIMVYNYKGLDAGKIQGTFDGDKLTEKEGWFSFKMPADGREHQIRVEVREHD